MRKDRRVNLSIKVPLTTSGTTTPVANTVYLSGASYNCTNAGTSWTLKIQDKAGTPAVVCATGTLTVSTTPVSVLSATPGIPMIGGIDLITAGTAGAMNVWLNYSFD